MPKKKVELEAGESIVLEAKTQTKLMGRNQEHDYSGFLTVTNKRVVFMESALLMGMELSLRLEDIESVSTQKILLFTSLNIFLKQPNKWVPKDGKKLVLTVAKPGAEAVKTAIDGQMKG